MNALGAETSASPDERVAIVTGGSRGIGAAIAHKLALSGIRPVIVCRDAEAGKAMAGSIQRLSGAAAGVHIADLANEGECSALVGAVAYRFGRVDALINNAAYFSTASLFDIDTAEFARTMAVNCLAPLLCGREFAKHVRERRGGGAIVNVSSVSARAVSANYGMYAASKAALDSLTRSMCVEWRQFGVSVNGVAPGHVRTVGVEEDLSNGRLDPETIAARTPAGRIASPDEVASVVAFLVSSNAQHIDGQTIVVDGGRSAML